MAFALLQALPLPIAALLAFPGCLTGPAPTPWGGDDHMGDMDRHMDGGMHGDESGNRPYAGTEDLLWNVSGGSPEEFRFEPDTLTVPVGATVGVTFTNVGARAHELTLPDLGFHLHAEAGETLQASFVAAQEGTYTFGCYIPGHFEAGMKGTVTVTPESD